MTPDRYMTRSPAAAALTRAELAIIRSDEAFMRWAYFLHQNVSGAPLSAQDISLLHSIRMHGQAQNLSELMLFLNRNDVSTIQYTLKKLEQSGYVERIPGKSKREAGCKLTEEGMRITDAFAELREELLVGLVEDVNGFVEDLLKAAATLERLTGIYDQSTQSALNRKILSP